MVDGRTQMNDGDAVRLRSSDAGASARSLANRDVLRLSWLCGLLLALAAAWNCREVLAFDFVAFDDDINIYFNPHMGPPTESSVRWMFTDVVYMRRYVPFGWLTFSSVYQFSGLSPAGYHAAGLVLHVVNTLLVFLVLLLLLQRFGASSASRWTVAAAALGTVLWSFHPFRAETIGWSSGLLYSASGMWALLSVVTYLRMQAAGPRGGWRVIWLGAAALSYGLSILTYPMSMALVGVFLAIDVAGAKGGLEGGRANWRRVAFEKLAFVVPCAAVLALTVFGRFEASSFWPRPPSWEEFSLAQRVAQGFAVWAYYLWKTWWPANLTPAVTWLFDLSLSRPVFALSTISIVGLTLALCFRRQWRGALPFWGAYVIILTPLLGFTEHPHFTSDRYAYLAGVVISAAAAFAIFRATGWWRAVLATLALVLSIGWSVLQHKQLRVWRNTDTLMACLVERSNDANFRAVSYRKWTVFHVHQGRPERAWEVLARGEKDVAGHPRLVGLRGELSKIDPDDATLPNVPAAARFHVKLAVDFTRANRTAEAHAHFGAALSLAPQSGTIAFNWGVLRALEGDAVAALRLYYRATAANAIEAPSASARARLLTLIAESFSARRQPTVAVHALEAALRLLPETEDPARVASLQARLATFRSFAAMGKTERTRSLSDL